MYLLTSRKIFKRPAQLCIVYVLGFAALKRLSKTKPAVCRTAPGDKKKLRLGDVEFVIADIPGLIEGAAEGRGLGHQFLRHVERARALCVLVDLAWESAGLPPPAEQERVLLAELEAYEPELLQRPRVIAGSRADLAPEAALGVQEAYRVQGVPLTLRSKERFTEFFAGTELIDPGVQVVSDWRAEEPADQRPSHADVSWYGGIGRVV